MVVADGQKKIAVINDMTGFGRCALTVSLPVISHMRIQCCPIPTSILSNHTGYDSYFFDDYTQKMSLYIEQWKKLGLQFDGIMSGFLGSKEQIAIVKDFIRTFKKSHSQIVVDPIMGDHGKLYATYTEEMSQEMRSLIGYADIITPNLTESCKLTDTPYRENGWNGRQLQEMAAKLSEMGPDKIVITGIVQGGFIANYVYQKGKEARILRTHKAGTERSGTGDLFAAIIASDAINGVDFDISVKKASTFVKKCILKSVELQIPQKDGVCFEEILHTLKI